MPSKPIRILAKNVAWLQDMVDKQEAGLCPSCGVKIYKKDFKDALSLKEFTISGLCQKCQDSVFG